MFGMIPFERHDDNMFDMFDNFQKKFFNDSNAKLPAFRTDIRDQGDKFLLEAELPGFQKEEISLELKEGILTIRAEHKESEAGQEGRVRPPGAPLRFLRPDLRCLRHRRERHHRRLSQRHPGADPAQAGPRGAPGTPDHHWLSLHETLGHRVSRCPFSRKEC